MWDGEQGGLPEIGLCDRIYAPGSNCAIRRTVWERSSAKDPDDLAAEECLGDHGLKRAESLKLDVVRPG